MPARTIATQGIPDTKPLGDVKSKQPAAPNGLELLFSPPTPHTTASGAHPPGDDQDANTSVPQNAEPEDEYTLSAYGDISLSEVVLPPLPSPSRSASSPLQPKSPPPRLRLRVRRPPMPKRRMSYTYIPDPLPLTGGLDDRYWPGSPRPIPDSAPWYYQHQPMVSPLPVRVSPTTTTHRDKPTKNGGSSLEKLLDDLLPRSPSIRLSPPGSPASQAIDLPQETLDQKDNDVQQGRNVRELDDGAKPPQSPPVPAPRQDKPKSAAWRTRLPPRLPIPKWDI